MSGTVKLSMLTKKTANDDLLDQLDGISLKCVGDKHMDFLKYTSRKLMVKSICNSLQRNFVCGILGNGATSLAKKLAIFAKEQGFFQRVAMVTVSRNLNMQEIRNGIIQQIQQEPINDCILILDGFWWELNEKDFEAVGIPSPSRSFRIVFASRSENVCKKIRNHLIFHVNILEDEEAWDLFIEQAGKSIVDSDLHEMARKIVDECDGYRIAILIIASALKDKPPEVWNDSLQRLESLNREERFPPNVTKLKSMSDMKVSWFHLSYDLLNDNEAQSMFLMCCLFNEDSNVAVEDLAMFGKGLHLLKNVNSMNQVRDRVDCIVHKLKDSFFLLDGDEDGFVKVQSMCRKFGLWISSKQKHPYVVRCESDMKAWPLKGTEYQNCRAISFICNTIEQHPVDLNCPKLHLLQLSYGSGSAELPNGIFEGVRNLRVLLLSIPSLSRPLTVLKKLRALCVTESTSNNRYIKTWPRIGALLGSNMKDLEIFLFHTERPYDDFSREIELLSNLRILKFNPKRLKYIPPGVLVILGKLEELYLPLDFINWGRKEEDGERINASIKEIEFLQLTAVGIGIPKGSILAQELVKNLTSFHVFIGSHVNPDYEFGTSGNLKKSLEVFDVYSNDFNASWISDLVRKSESLRLKQVKNLNSIITWQWKQEEDANTEFPQWKKICISDCKELIYLVAGQIPWTSFSQLKSLKLFGLHNLREIWNGLYLSKIEGSCFGNLAEIQIMFCRKLKHVFSISVAAELRQLQSLQLCFCEEMEAIFYRHQMNDDGNQVATSSKEDEQYVAKDAIIFSQLKTMELAYLDKLRIFFDGNHPINCLYYIHCQSFDAIAWKLFLMD